MTNDTQAALIQLVQDTDLQSIEFHELYASRSFGGEYDAEAEGNPNYEMTMQTRTGDSDLGVRLAIRVLTGQGNIRAVVAADYTNRGQEPDGHVMQRFATEVGVMALVPYARQAVADLSQRVFGQSLLMPVVKREDVRVEQLDGN